MISIAESLRSLIKKGHCYNDASLQPWTPHRTAFGLKRSLHILQNGQGDEPQ